MTLVADSGRVRHQRGAVRLTDAGIPPNIPIQPVRQAAGLRSPPRETSPADRAR
jgi:hypothetical protein